LYYINLSKQVSRYCLLSIDKITKQFCQRTYPDCSTSELKTTYTANQLLIYLAEQIDPSE